MGEPTDEASPLDAGQRPQTFRAGDASDDCDLDCEDGRVCIKRSTELQCAPSCTSNPDCKAGLSGPVSCINGACIPLGCISDDECRDGLLCRKGACVAKQCDSNRDCDADLVCSVDKTCVQPFEEEPSPGCSAAGEGASRGIVLVAVVALLVAAVRARRARRPVRRSTPPRAPAPRA